MIAEALRYADDPHAPRVEGTVSAPRRTRTGASSWGHHVRRVLMTGVSYMIPFVAAGGLLIALGFLFGGYEIAKAQPDGTGTAAKIMAENNLFNLPDPAALGLDHALFDSSFFAYVGAVFFVLGATAFKFLVPGAGRLHRLRDRRPARHRARLRHGCARRRPGRLRPAPERLPRRHHRRRAGRLHRPVDHPLEGRRPGRAA